MREMHVLSNPEKPEIIPESHPYGHHGQPYKFKCNVGDNALKGQAFSKQIPPNKFMSFGKH